MLEHIDDKLEYANIDHFQQCIAERCSFDNLTIFLIEKVTLLKYYLSLKLPSLKQPIWCNV